MWSAIFVPSKLIEIVRHLSEIQIIKYNQGCLNIYYLRKFLWYKKRRLNLTRFKDYTMFSIHTLTTINWKPKTNYKSREKCLTYCMTPQRPCLPLVDNLTYFGRQVYGEIIYLSDKNKECGHLLGKLLSPKVRELHDHYLKYVNYTTTISSTWTTRPLSQSTWTTRPLSQP